MYFACADPEKGGGSGLPPPLWDFYLISIIIFWLAPLASIKHGVKIWKILITSKFKRVIPFPVIHTIPGFIYASAISMLILSKITWFYTILTKNCLGEDPPNPVHPAPVTSLGMFVSIYIYNKDGKYNSEKNRLKSMRPTKYANMYFAYEVAPKHFF